MTGSNSQAEGQAHPSRALVDPEIAPLIDLLPLSDLDHAGLEDARRRSAVDPRLFDSRIIPEPIAIGGGEGGPLRALLFRPPRERASRGAILHLHGGGMVMGSPDMARVSMPHVALLHGVAVLSIDYRLAPETPFPGQLDDTERALSWLLGHADTLSIDKDRIVLMGESAGGGLAAGFALQLRDQGGPTLAGQILVYPMLDCRTGAYEDPYDHGPAGQFIWTGPRNAFGWAALAGSGAPRDNRMGWFSPALADDLSGLPPTFIATGALDLFAAENLAFARRLAAAGVPVELHLYEGALHGFDLMRRSRVAGRYRRDLDEWVSARLSTAHSDQETPSK